MMRKKEIRVSLYDDFRIPLVPGRNFFPAFPQPKPHTI